MLELAGCVDTATWRVMFRWIQDGLLMIPRDRLERVEMHPALGPACVSPCSQGRGSLRIRGARGAVPAHSAHVENLDMARGVQRPSPSCETHPEKKWKPFSLSRRILPRLCNYCCQSSRGVVHLPSVFYVKPRATTT